MEAGSHNTGMAEREVLRAINRAADMREVMRIALGHLRRRWGVEGLGLQILDPETQRLLSVRLVDVDAQRENRLQELQDRAPMDLSTSRSAEVARSRRRHHARLSPGHHAFASELDRLVAQKLGVKENLMLPVLGGEQVIGVLHVGSYRRFLDLSEEDCDRIEQFLGNLTGYVIATQAQELLRRQQRRLEQTLATVRRLSVTLDLDEVLDLLGQQLSSLADGYCVNLLEPDSGRLRMLRVQLPPGYQAIAHTYQDYRLRSDEDDPNILALREGRVLTLDQDSIRRFADSSRLRFERWNMRHLVIVPLTLEDGPAIGTLMLFSQDAPLPPKVVELACERLPLFVKPLQNALAHRDYRDREEEMLSASKRQLAFLEFLVGLGEVHRRDDLYEASLDGLLACFPQYDFAALHLRQDDRLVLQQFRLRRGEPREVRDAVLRLAPSHAFEIKREDGATPTCFIQNEKLFFGDIPAIIHLPMSPKDADYLQALDQAKSFACFPVRDRGQPVGVLWLGARGQHVALDQSEHRAIELVCTYLGTPLRTVAMVEQIEAQRSEIERLNERLSGRVDELNVLVSRDALTGLHNTRDLEGCIRRCMAAVDAGLDERGLCLMMLDVDHFKRVNDEHGHLVGDGVLRAVAERLRRYGRREDLAYRYGGEEFLLLLPYTGEQEAVRAAERLREVIADQPIEVDGRRYHVTASFGISSYRGQASPKQLIEQADQALYAAKRAGRDQVATRFAD